MAKLYWRVKRDEKWTWVAATMDNTDMYRNSCDPQKVEYIDVEEEE